MKYVMEGNPETGTLKIPHLIVAQSYACNYRCVDCNVPKHITSIEPGIMHELVDKWADYVSKNTTDNKGIFHLKGGEPFMFDDLWNILNQAADKGLYIFLTTNASKINKNEIEKLRHLYEKTDGQIIISLDGSTKNIHELSRQPKSYDTTVNAIKKLKDAGLPVAINYRVHKENQHDVEKAIYLAMELGAEQFNLLPHTKIRAASNGILQLPDLKVILPQLERVKNNGAKDLLEGCVLDAHRYVGCTAGFNGLAYITPDGSVYSCPNTTMSKLGTIEDSFEELFKSKTAKNLKESYEEMIVCKGEIEAYKNQPENLEKLLLADKLIKERRKTKPNEDKPLVARCFNRNW